MAKSFSEKIKGKKGKLSKSLNKYRPIEVSKDIIAVILKNDITPEMKKKRKRATQKLISSINKLRKKNKSLDKRLKVLRIKNLKLAKRRNKI